MELLLDELVCMSVTKMSTSTDMICNEEQFHITLEKMYKLTMNATKRCGIHIEQGRKDISVANLERPFIIRYRLHHNT